MEEVGQINWCRYFTGIQEEKCENGIAYRSVRDSGQGLLPCIGIVCPGRCALASYPTRAEIVAEAQRVKATMDAWREQRA